MRIEAEEVWQIVFRRIEQVPKNLGGLVDVGPRDGQEKLPDADEVRLAVFAGAEAERQRQGGGARRSDRGLEMGGVAGDGGA